MIGLAAALLLAAQPAVARPDHPSDLDRYREIVTAIWWADCCATYRGGVPADIQRRIEAVGAALERRYGAGVVGRSVMEARADFEEEFGTYDPLPRRYSADQQRRSRLESRGWFDARLDALEARLGLAAR
jgi:hypothetical protein